MASYNKIDYRLRPAKAVERKMIVDAIKKLSFFHNIERYRYIGFGSIFFTDFSLFHKVLGINDMISIDHQHKSENRFHFNNPYSFIKVYCDQSNVVLPKLNWDKPSIIWLDYDFDLNSSILNDINTVCANAIDGSLLIITVKAHPAALPTELAGKINIEDYRFEFLKDLVGIEKIPMDTKASDLSGKKLSKILRTILINEISSNLKNRNGVLNVVDQLQFNQIFNFKYQDGAIMLTIGGLIIKKSQQQIMTQARFEDLNFLSYNDSETTINVPILTLREIKYIDSVLHKHIYFKGGAYKLKKKFKSKYDKFLEEEDILNYNQIYRYYPTFTESIL